MDLNPLAQAEDESGTIASPDVRLLGSPTLRTEGYVPDLVGQGLAAARHEADSGGYCKN
jgi:hypothetical protein